MKNKIGFPKLCANETLLNEYYKDVSSVIDLNAKSFLCLLGLEVVLLVRARFLVLPLVLLIVFFFFFFFFVLIIHTASPFVDLCYVYALVKTSLNAEFLFLCGHEPRVVVTTTATKYLFGKRIQYQYKQREH